MLLQVYPVARPLVMRGSPDQTCRNPIVVLTRSERSSGIVDCSLVRGCPGFVTSRPGREVQSSLCDWTYAFFFQYAGVGVVFVDFEVWSVGEWFGTSGKARGRMVLLARRLFFAGGDGSGGLQYPRCIPCQFSCKRMVCSLRVNGLGVLDRGRQPRRRGAVSRNDRPTGPLAIVAVRAAGRRMEGDEVDEECTYPRQACSRKWLHLD